MLSYLFPQTVHRSLRPLIAGIATAGLIATLHPALIDSLIKPANCSAESCNAVAGTYATLFTLPLPIVGFLAYFSVAISAIAPLSLRSNWAKSLRSKLEIGTKWLLLASGTMAIIFSGYLLYLTIFPLKTFGTICLFIAGCSVVLLLLILRLFEKGTMKQLLLIANVIGTVTFAGFIGIYIDIQAPAHSQSLSQPIAHSSKPATIALAQHLKQVGAKMYGAFWCSHCQEQKQEFGQTAWAQIQYIECDPSGEQSQTDRCKAAQVKGFPTWEINGQLYLGTQSLQQLADLSNYPGSRDF